MEETLVLISLVIVMLIGSFIAGSIPLFFTFSEDKLKKITVFGAGLLVGTALNVIIPEGVRSLISNDDNTASPIISTTSTNSHANERGLAAIGPSLVLGFVFMLIVDRLSQSNETNGNITATVGLVVHAAADGVALGAAATTSHADVEMIVFLAIMLHKAPAAFGLVTFLMHEGIDRRRIRRHLAIFALAAPVLTVLTYFGIGQKQKETLNNLNATGIAMLFSAGTFLYVATVHVLAELTQGDMHHNYTKLDMIENGGGVNGNSNTKSMLKSSELFILILGCLTPFLLTMGHHH